MNLSFLFCIGYEPALRFADNALDGVSGVEPAEIDDPAIGAAFAFQHHESIDRRVLDGAEAGFAGPQRLFGPDKVADVRNHIHQPSDPALVVAHGDLGMTQQRQDLTIRPHDPIADLQPVLGLQLRLDRLGEVALVRVEARVPLVVRAAGATDPARHVKTEQRQALVRPDPDATDEVGFPGADSSHPQG